MKEKNYIWKATSVVLVIALIVVSCLYYTQQYLWKMTGKQFMATMLWKNEKKETEKIIKNFLRSFFVTKAFTQIAEQKPHKLPKKIRTNHRKQLRSGFGLNSILTKQYLTEKLHLFENYSKI